MFNGDVIEKNSQKEKMLPIYYPSPITNYLHHTYYSAICLGRKNFEMFFHRYIQLYWRDIPQQRFSFYPDSYSLLFLPVMKWVCLEPSYVIFSKENILDYMFKWIDNEYYIFIDLIEGLLDVTRLKGKMIIHPNLFFGYNKSKKVFHLLNFNARGAMSLLEVPFDNFINSFCSDQYKPLVKDTPWITDTHEAYPRIMLMQCSEGFNYAFKGKAMYNQLYDYLHSKNSLESTYISMNDNGSEYVWGIDIYAEIQNYLAEHRSKNYLDKKIFHGFYEHKKIMQARLKYLEQKKMIDPEKSLSNNFKFIEENAEKVRLLSLKYNFKPKEDTLDEMTRLIQEIKTTEIPLLTKLLNEIAKIK